MKSSTTKLAGLVAILAIVLLVMMRLKQPTPYVEPSKPKPSMVDIQPMGTPETDFIKKQLSGATLPQLSRWDDAWSVPNGIHDTNLTRSFSLTDRSRILFALQPNMNYPPEQNWDPVTSSTFVGALLTIDNGKSWYDLFKIPANTLGNASGTDLVHINPLGFFYENHRYALDLGDDRGGGSGESILKRYWTRDGKTWTKERGCYYMIPEQYYNDDRSIVHPHAIKAITCPAYMR